MNRRFMVLTGASAIAVAVTVYAATRIAPRPDARPPEAAAPFDVTLVTASLDDLGQPFEIGGEVRAHESATIMSRIVAEVREVRVAAGDLVRAGQPLVVLDARGLNAERLRAQAAVAAAEQAAASAAAERQAADAALTLASATYRRVAELRQKNSATASEMDTAVASVEAARARAKSAEAQVSQSAAGIEVAKATANVAAVGESYATLTAPFDGIVTQKLVDPGNMASPGIPLLTVEDARSFRLDVRIDETLAPLVTVGQSVPVILDAAAGSAAGPTTLAGRVSEIARVLDPNAHAFLAKIDLPPVAGLRAGMFARARLSGPARRVLVLPETTIVRRGQLTSVFVVARSDIAELRLITVGEALDGRIEVRAGLDAGERVVAAPPAGLVDGSRVRVLPSSSARRAEPSRWMATAGGALVTRSTCADVSEETLSPFSCAGLRGSARERA